MAVDLALVSSLGLPLADPLVDSVLDFVSASFSCSSLFAQPATVIGLKRSCILPCKLTAGCTCEAAVAAAADELDARFIAEAGHDHQSSPATTRFC